MKEKDIHELAEEWENEVRAPYVEKHPERRPRYINDLGYEIKPLYTPADLDERGFSYEKDCGFPGQPPYTRGDLPNMNRSDHMYTGCYSGFGAAEESKERYEKVVGWGCNKLEMAWDLPTQIGYDSDHIMATGEIGRTGVAVDTLKDMEIMFENIPLDSLKGFQLLSNSLGPVGIGLIIALSRKQGLQLSQLRGFLQNDPLKEYSARGTYIFPMAPAVKLACDAVEWCIMNASHWKPICFCANHLNAAGAGSVNAAAFAMCNAFVYIDELVSRGYTVEQIIPLTRILMDEREDFFAMAALGRAVRKVWAQQIAKRYGVTDPLSPALRIDLSIYSHGGETLTEPINNILRIGFSALAYYLGGASYMYNAGYDEAMGLTSETTCKVSVRTSQIIDNELGFSKTADPLAGSYYVESLTMDMANDMTKQIEYIVDTYGDSQKAMRDGYFQSIISRGAVRRQSEFEKGERQFVSLNIFPTEESLPTGAYRIDPSLEQRQLARLQKVKTSRNGILVTQRLDALREATKANRNTVDAVVACLEAYCTIGEICDVWRGVYGEFQSLTTF
ncbi:MAG: methylmalonyl-CoA mutase family protein [Clostridiales Family XIII bacterium]|jgi:methylmalonyl-CoA mutase N-terminal domain/subunit|nr:methylmalonyl-CoA mutase family protein [Clostridiales Family XIII bacterium]